MDMLSSPPTRDGGHDTSLAAVLAALAPHEEKALVIEYDGRTIGAGYHVTEVKAGAFVTLDCGGNPDAWNETILQVEDLPAAPGRSFMPVAKFRSILGKVAGKIALADDARLTVEVGPPGAPMQVFDVASIRVEDGRAVMALGPRPAICKPRHRAAAASRCCG
jgi:hypothetical protein